MASLLRSRISLSLGNVALRHQLAVYKHTVHRPRLRPTDRLFWVWLSRLWPGWQEALAFVHLGAENDSCKFSVGTSMLLIGT